ncbi:cyclase family protein [Geochorda subterranea]|uniref:Cyclase family protein n=1 Tax=Geochorda subterranea TaxID=3109564 RepID=A0ABZ1BSE3_9FIRM|nr:cyclase family protein [Limnochorda sp. LNt]WRP15659.1 cyclase family protein [Limnochorda sp. LNt]
MCAPSVVEHVASRLSRRELLGAAAGALAASLLPASRGVARAASPAPATQRLSFENVADLTHVLSPDFPVFPSFEPMKVTNLFTVARDGFYANRWDLGEHTGTHFDAPVHFVDRDGVWSLDQVPPERLVAPLAVIHIHERAARDPDAWVTVDDLMAWEARYGRIPDGAIVCMHSGWESRVGDADAYRNADASGTMHFPGFSPQAAQWLVHERDIVGIGVDTLSLDIGPSTGFEVHLTVLGANLYGLENLANLARVPPAGATVIVGAPRVRGASGGPCRVLAVW